MQLGTFARLIERIDGRSVGRKLLTRTFDAAARFAAHAIAYRLDLERLIDLAGAPFIIGIDCARHSPVCAKLMRVPLSASIARTLSAWRSMYRWLCERGDAFVNPVVGVRGPKRVKRLPKALSADQAVTFASKPADESLLAWRDHAIVELLYSSGLRLAELVSLDRRYFDAEASLPASISWVDLAAAEATVVGKGNKTRRVPIGAPACVALVRWLNAREALPRRDDRALFVSAAGARLSARSVQSRIALYHASLA